MRLSMDLRDSGLFVALVRHAIIIIKQPHLLLVHRYSDMYVCYIISTYMLSAHIFRLSFGRTADTIDHIDFGIKLKHISQYGEHSPEMQMVA